MDPVSIVFALAFVGIFLLLAFIVFFSLKPSVPSTPKPKPTESNENFTPLTRIGYASGNNSV